MNPVFFTLIMLLTLNSGFTGILIYSWTAVCRLIESFYSYNVITILCVMLMATGMSHYHLLRYVKELHFKMMTVI